MLTEKAVSIKSHMNKFLCHVHIIKVCMGNESLAFLTILSAYVQKNIFFIHLLSFMFIFSSPSPKIYFPVQNVRKCWYRENCSLKSHPSNPQQQPTYISSRYFPFQYFFSSVWHMRRESHFIHCTFMGLIWLSHTWQLFFFLAKFPLHFLHSHPQLNANKIIFPTRWWKKKFCTQRMWKKSCYVNKYHCIISRECFSEMPSHLLRGGWKKKS